MKKYLLSLFVAISFWSCAQEDSMNTENVRLIHKNHIGFSVGGPGFLGYYYEHFFNHNWSIEVGLGSVLVLTGIYTEGRYYFGSKDKPDKIAPYIGFGGGACMILGLDDGYVTPMVYAPVGLQIFNSRGFAFSMEAAVFRFDGETFPMGALKFRLMKKKKSSR